MPDHLQRKAKRPPGEVYRLGEDEAFRDPKAKDLLFVIGGETPTPERFEHQVTPRDAKPS